MKKMRKISLTDLSKDKMSKREQNRVLGGEDCCACYCKTEIGAIGISGGGLQMGTDIGYGIGKFA